MVTLTGVAIIVGPFRLSEEAASLAQRIPERPVALPRRDQVEEIAMFIRRTVLPFPSGALALGWASEAHEEGSPLGIAGIADDPVASRSSAVGEIVPADRFNTIRQLRRELARRGTGAVMIVT